MMNRILLSLLLHIFLSPFLFAQSFTETDKQWNIKTGFTFQPNISTYILVTQGEEEINGLTYKPIYRFEDEELTDGGPTGEYVREDENGKVYLLRADATEVLLYDFGLSIGDTFLFDNFCNLLVIDEDQVQVQDGSMRKRLTLAISPNSDPVTWVEGVGTMGDFRDGSFMACATDYGRLLLCHSELGANVYPVDPPVCYETTISVSESFVETGVNISPNPVKGSFTLSLDGDDVNEIRNLRIMDARGILVDSYSNISTTHIINTEALAQGIYFVHIEISPGVSITKKISVIR